MRLMLLKLKGGFELNEIDQNDDEDDVILKREFNEDLFRIIGNNKPIIPNNIFSTIQRTGFNVEENIFETLKEFSISSMIFRYY